MDTKNYLAFLGSRIGNPDTFCMGCRSPIGLYPMVPASLKTCFMCGNCQWQLQQFRKRYEDVDPEPEVAHNEGETYDEGNAGEDDDGAFNAPPSSFPATPGGVPDVRQPMPTPTPTPTPTSTPTPTPTSTPTRTPVVSQPSASSAGHYSGKPKPPQLCVYYFTKASGCTNPGCTRSHAYRAPEGACPDGPNCSRGQYCWFFGPRHSW
jgi:hypothetical protein